MCYSCFFFFFCLQFYFFFFFFFQAEDGIRDLYVTGVQTCALPIWIARLRRIERLGGEVLAMASDVSDPVAVRDLIARAEQRFGRLDGVVHAAGLPGGGLVQALEPD